MSVGNLYLCEKESRQNHEDVNGISNEVAELQLSESYKHVSRNKSTGALKKADSTASINKVKAGPSRSSASCLRVASKEHIDRLAQPKKHYGSAQNLDQSNYVSVAEFVRKFQIGTPQRFRNKSKLETGCSKQTSTIPQSPALKTKQRHRPVNAVSREEQEMLEYEGGAKVQNKGASVKQKNITGPNKAPRTDRKETGHSSRAVQNYSSSTKGIKMHTLKKKKLTVPQTPSFMRRYKKEPVKPEQPAKQECEGDKHASKSMRTAVVPFSFERRDMYLQKMKEERIRRVLEEERKAREFHARPAPKAILSSAKGSTLQRSNSTNSSRTNSVTKSDENISCQFKARPATVLYKKPFEPKKERHLIEISEFQLNTELRAKEREEFEQFKKEKEERIAQVKQTEEELRLQMEEEEVARLRKRTEYKAQPVKKYKELKIEPSGKVTVPISPKFHVNKHRRDDNDKGKFKGRVRVRGWGFIKEGDGNIGRVARYMTLKPFVMVSLHLREMEGRSGARSVFTGSEVEATDAAS
ncbi:hypothetical protein NQ318_021971 [Aromia moschata]|uniref:TPX2 C-terminal domain-containing protein n=1 Tax=Aromia moschata TaxID=1265417 RepID=A0AAV8Z689_9CUCU|nr:hypothetical protein NQ318_021971 [Aromia moschata]